MLESWLEARLQQLEAMLADMRHGNAEFDVLLLDWHLRRVRDMLAECPIFGEPAWEIMLDLYIAEQSHRRVQVSSVGAGAHVPPTTILRYLTQLEERGWVRRVPDPHDKRRVFVVLSDEGRHMLQRIGEGAMKRAGRPRRSSAFAA